jgi:hypothetical protein
MSSLLNFDSEYAIRCVKDNQKGLEMIGTYQLLVSDHVTNLFGENI